MQEKDRIARKGALYVINLALGSFPAIQFLIYSAIYHFFGLMVFDIFSLIDSTLRASSQIMVHVKSESKFNYFFENSIIGNYCSENVSTL